MLYLAIERFLTFAILAIRQQIISPTILTTSLAHKNKDILLKQQCNKQISCFFVRAIPFVKRIKQSSS